MIAVDTNILIFAHREDSEFHRAARKALETLTSGPEVWAIPWPCVHEFYGVVTRGGAYRPATPIPVAIQVIDGWASSSLIRVLTETPRHWQVLRDILQNSEVTGPLVHDARIAAICIQHEISELWTADRDFSRFPQLRCVNPLRQ